MSFSTKFLKTKKILLYSITWSLTLNFHHLVKKNLPAKSHFNPHWENFYNTLFFSFKKDLNGQNHSSSDSNTTQKFPSQQNFPSPQWADMPGLPTSVENMGGLESIHGRDWGGGRGKMLLKIICEVFYMLVKLPAISLQKPANLLKMNFFTHTFQGF